MMKILNYDVDSISIKAMCKVEGFKPSPLLNKLINLFTLKVKKQNEEYSILHLYKDLGNNIYEFPRAFFNRVAPPVPIKKEWKVSFKCKASLKDYQQQLTNKILEDYKNNSFGGILQAGTGTGKTIMALKIASEIGLKTIVIVPRNFIINQWIDRICEHTNIIKNEIGILHQNKIDIDNKIIVVAMLQSISSRLERYPQKVYNSFGLSIWDEGHLLGAETFSKTVSLFNDRYRLMLSATPDRKDGADKVFLYHIGKVIASYDKTLLTPTIYCIKNNNKNTNSDSFVWRKKFKRSSYLTYLSKLLNRNILIANYIKLSVANNRKVLVASERIEQLEVISKLVGLPTSRFYSKYKEINHNIILATYNAMSMAVDIPAIDTLILATPQTDVRQIIGRILREDSNKRFPVVFDILDTASTHMNGSFNLRLRYYKSKKMKIKFINIGGDNEK